MMGSGADAATPRYRLLDLLRGAALLAMAVYHVAWDLVFLGLADIPVARDPFWLWFRSAVISIFLALVGINLVLVGRGGLDWRRHAMRLLRLTAAAAAISVATWLLAPGQWVFFGVLHCIALAGLLLLPALWLPAWATAALGVAVIAADRLRQPAFDQPAFDQSAFDQSALWWIGLGTMTPPALDYVPVIPWFGPVLIGMAAGRLLFPVDGGSRLPAWQPVGRASRLVAWFGRHSLLFYLLHQPILLALLATGAWFAGRP